MNALRVAASGLGGLVIMAASGCQQTLSVGDPVPGILEQCPPSDLPCSIPAVPRVVWVFTTDDCLRCLGFPQLLRSEWKRRGEEAFAFEALHVREVEEEPTDWLVAYFMKERLTPTIRSIDQQRFEMEFGSLLLPALLIISGERVLSVSQGEPEALEEALAHFGPLEFDRAPEG